MPSEDFFVKLITGLGPYGFTVLLIVYMMLAEKGIVPKFGGKRNGNGNGDKDYHTIMTNHLPHLESRINELDNHISDIKVNMEKKVPFDWAEKKFEKLENDMNKRFDRLEDKIK